MNVKLMVIKSLEDNGFSGLYHNGEECGCEIDDLMPCEEYCGNCLPGYKVKNAAKEDNFGWMILPTKESKK